MPSTGQAIHHWASEPGYLMFIAAAEERAGCLIGFATQCSVAPLGHGA